MKILKLQDREGDEVYVSAFEIVGLEVVAIQSSPSDDVWRATSIRTAAGRINVAEAISVVYERWMAAIADEAAPSVKAHPEARGWEVHDVVARSRG